MSRLQQVRDAVRPEMKARLLLAGPPGAGKTRTALVIAATLAGTGKPLVIDTEEESALTYADDFSFKHLPWGAPYDPRELSETLHDAGTEWPVVCIDSLTHFWRDEGGTLDIAGGKFTGWKAARPAQRDLIKAILRLPVHVIVCVRSKVEYTQVEKNGKQTVEKLGMAHEQDDSLEYEVNVSAELDMDHRLTIAKTRCPVLSDKMFPPGERHVGEMAEMYAAWLRGGEPVAAPSVVADLKARMDALAPSEYRSACKRRFIAEISRPEYLREAQVGGAVSLVALFEDEQPRPDKPQGDGIARDAIEADEGHVAGAGQVRQEAGPPSGDAQADAEAAAPAKPTKPKAPSWARDLHVRASKVFGGDAAKAVDAKLDALILNCTRGRTRSAAETNGSEAGAVIELLRKVEEGYVSVTATDDLGRVTVDWNGTAHVFVRDAAGDLVYAPTQAAAS